MVGAARPSLFLKCHHYGLSVRDFGPLDPTYWLRAFRAFDSWAIMAGELIATVVSLFDGHQHFALGKTRRWSALVGNRGRGFLQLRQDRGLGGLEYAVETTQDREGENDLPVVGLLEVPAQQVGDR